MPSDYVAITAENVINRGKKFDDIGNFLAEKLYGDKSQFIYELLQNAEDALARRRQEDPDGDIPGDIHFDLYTDHLEVRHSGRPFDEEDVRGISDVFRGTKNERLDQIGTFGIGFKSVYALTRSPEVHSGDEHFVIERYIRPRSVPPRQHRNQQETLFYLPFDHPEFSAAAAFELIRDKLKLLGPRSLLFLNHIKNLGWTVEGAGSGFNMREVHPSGHGGALVEIVGDADGGGAVEEEWLVMQREVAHPTRSDLLPIKIAYQLISLKEGKSIRAVQESCLAVYFPTRVRTDLGFLIHGPFEPTPARDNIVAHSDWNKLLVSELAALAADSLAICQRHGFLTADFLGTLPIDEDRFPPGSMFRPFYDAVLTAMTSQPLIPRANGTHAAAAELVLGRSQELRELLTAPLLQALLMTEPECQGWVSPGVSENRMPKVWQYLREACGIRVVDGDGFAREIATSFLRARDDEWMSRFYAFLTGQEALWREKSYRYAEGPLRSKQFIRCEDGNHRRPFDQNGRPQVFLPVDTDTRFPTVKRLFASAEEPSEFFRKLGLIPPDLCTEVLHSVLPAYGKEEVPIDVHEQHLQIIGAALSLEDSPRYGEMRKALREQEWVLSRCADGTDSYQYRKPSSTYSSRPELQKYFEGNSEAFFLAETDTEIDWLQLGVRSEPEVSCKGIVRRRTTPHASVPLWSRHGWHGRGIYCFDPDTEVDGMHHALGSIDAPKATYIWNELLPAMIPFLHGKWEVSTRQTFDDPDTYEDDSSLGKLVKTMRWVPVIGGEFRIPKECTVADLHEDLRCEKRLLDALGVQPDPSDVARQHAERYQGWVTLAGFSAEVAALLVENKARITVEAVEELLRAESAGKNEKPEFPNRPVSNPERRGAKVDERVQTAAPKVSEKRTRRVRASSPPIEPKIWLREQYTNPMDVMVCQMCREAMPFKLPGGEAYYFEAVQISDELDREEHTIYLALCPLCASKYKVLVKTDKSQVAAFCQSILESDELTVPVESANGVMKVSFVETHHHDLKHALPNCKSQPALGDSEHD